MASARNNRFNSSAAWILEGKYRARGSCNGSGFCMRFGVRDLLFGLEG